MSGYLPLPPSRTDGAWMLNDVPVEQSVTGNVVDGFPGLAALPLSCFFSPLPSRSPSLPLPSTDVSFELEPTKSNTQLSLEYNFISVFHDSFMFMKEMSRTVCFYEGLRLFVAIRDKSTGYNWGKDVTDWTAQWEQRTLFSTNTDRIFMIVMSVWKRPLIFSRECLLCIFWNWVTLKRYRTDPPKYLHTSG